MTGFRETSCTVGSDNTFYNGNLPVDTPPVLNDLYSLNLLRMIAPVSGQLWEVKGKGMVSRDILAPNFA